MPPRSRHPHCWIRLTRLSLSALLLAAAGCEEEPRHSGGQPSTAARPRAILNQRTQDIRPAAPELQAGARVAGTRITARDPITLPGNAYVTIIGRTSMFEIEKAMQLYQATNDRYPRDFQEFMTDVVKANQISLPVLPYYQEYGYDEKEHKLVILEYPDRKEQAPRP
jgi:hypothetical protein